MSKRTLKNGQYISDETVSELNDKHGWFQYEDAQSDVSRAFANNAVHAFLEIAKEAEEAKQETGMTPMELVSHIYDLKARIAELEKDAMRWKKVLHHVGADNHHGGAHYVIRGINPPANVMRGAVSQHFEKSIDTAMQKD